MTGPLDFDRIEDHIRILTERIDNIHKEDEESYAQKFILRQMIRFFANMASYAQHGMFMSRCPNDAFLMFSCIMAVVACTRNCMCPPAMSGCSAIMGFMRIKWRSWDVLHQGKCPAYVRRMSNKWRG